VSLVPEHGRGYAAFSNQRFRRRHSDWYNKPTKDLLFTVPGAAGRETELPNLPDHR